MYNIHLPLFTSPFLKESYTNSVFGWHDLLTFLQERHQQWLISPPRGSQPLDSPEGYPAPQVKNENRGLAAATKKIVKKAKRKDPDCITLSSDEEDEEETVIEFEEDDEVGFLILKLLTLKSPPHCYQLGLFQGDPGLLRDLYHFWGLL